MSLEPLALPDLASLVRDALHCDLEAAEPLARLVSQKTGGNPFFVGQFLKALREAELLRFDYEREQWTFEMDAIARAGMTDNVIDLMTRKIQRLSPGTQRVLTLASCIGNPFDLQTLAIVCEQSPEDVAEDLAGAIEEGLVLTTARGHRVRLPARSGPAVRLRPHSLRAEADGAPRRWAGCCNPAASATRATSACSTSSTT